MAEPFDSIFDIIVGEEGGYTDDPHDPGGETNWGIDKASHPNVDIKSLTKDQAEAIYLAQYWLPASCPEYPPGLALLAFDAAVNNGVARACEWLQAAVGVATDGIIGTQTLLALKIALAETDTNVEAEFLARRVDFMAGLSTWRYFGLGWSRRLAALPFHADALTASLQKTASTSADRLAQNPLPPRLKLAPLPPWPKIPKGMK